MPKRFLSAEIIGADELDAVLRGLDTAATSAAFEGLRQGTHLVVRAAKDGIRKGPKTGRVYTHRFPSVFAGGPRRPQDKRSRPHQASAPGEYPAADTGNLIRSIHDEHPRPEEAAAGGAAVFGAEVFADASYAAALEFKPEEKGGRPFLRRALAENQEAVRQEILSRVKRAMAG